MPERVYNDVKIWEEELYRYGLSDKEIDNIMYLNAGNAPHQNLEIINMKYVEKYGKIE